jgi:hypothetical protein
VGVLAGARVPIGAHALVESVGWQGAVQRSV